MSRFTKTFVITSILSIISLSSALGEGSSSSVDIQLAKSIMEEANAGNPKAQYGLGGIYEKGLFNFKVDPQKAVLWYTRAATEGLDVAQNKLGTIYSKGEGVEVDHVQAAAWYLKAAEQGNTKAQNNLGLSYTKGLGVPKDFVMAVNWFRKAAEMGEAEAQHNLAVRYHFGEGVPKDYKLEAFWMSQAAEKGHAGAQSNLGLFYAEGKGVEKDNTKAIYWLRRAAEQGHSIAQHNLAHRYSQGDGVAKDEVEAYAYYNLAGISLEASRNNLAILEKKLSREEIFAGQNRTKELQKLVEATQVTLGVKNGK
jgi:TPR repeat protein